MLQVWRSLGARAQWALQLLVVFAIARVIAGLIMIAFVSDAIAWGYEITAIIAGCAVVYVLVALAVRRWAPPRTR